ncbi:MAG: 4Fe-4S binding protein, partial [Clostridiales Family XIII bacterium]|nr:4Fe-4S binding protein [Clostridiales Family XIII bacterium]
MAVKIIDEKCIGCKLCQKACPFDAIDMVGKLAVINAKCTNCKQCIPACKKHQAIYDDAPEDIPEVVDLSAYKHVWVYAEQRAGKLMNVALELLGEGRRLARDLGGGAKVYAVLIGAEEHVDPLTQECFEYGADAAVVIGDPLLARYTTDGFTKVFTDAIRVHRPEIVLFGATHIGRDLAPRVAARLNTGLTADCTRLDVKVSTYIDYANKN